MILQRQGNKKKLFKKIKEYIPEHEIYIESFFGSGSIFFMKDRAKYNFLNDLDNEVYNLFKILREKPKQFENLLKIVPVHKTQFNYWKKNEEISDLWRAVRFIYLTNFSYMSSGHTMRNRISNTKFLTLSRIKETFDSLMDTRFDNDNYKNFIKNINLETKKGRGKIFIYCDPPYIKTANVYNTPKWKIDDLEELIVFLINYGEKFMISEFDTAEVVELATKYDLIVEKLGERRNINNRRVEIIIKNY